MLILLEGAVMCFVLLLICVVAIADGPVGAVFFYEPEVRERVVHLGLTTKETIRKRYAVVSVCLFAPVLFLVPAMVYFVNGARGFVDVFWQITAVLMITGLFDRIFIDWYWVSKTNAWLIPGTEDLKPYVPARTMAYKWIGTLVGYPLLAAISAAILSLF